MAKKSLELSVINKDAHTMTHAWIRTQPMGGWKTARCFQTDIMKVYVSPLNKSLNSDRYCHFCTRTLETCVCVRQHTPPSSATESISAGGCTTPYYHPPASRQQSTSLRCGLIWLTASTRKTPRRSTVVYGQGSIYSDHLELLVHNFIPQCI